MRLFAKGSVLPCSNRRFRFRDHLISVSKDPHACRNCSYRLTKYAIFAARPDEVRSVTHSSRFVETPRENSLKTALVADDRKLASLVCLFASGIRESKSLSVRLIQIA